MTTIPPLLRLGVVAHLPLILAQWGSNRRGFTRDSQDQGAHQRNPQRCEATASPINTGKPAG